MPTPRKQQISLSDTPYYHCISRCVRRAYLCGTDTSTGKDYNHRKDWIAERLALLANTFAIDICAYSILSNHMHSVLKINAQQPTPGLMKRLLIVGNSSLPSRY